MLVVLIAAVSCSQTSELLETPVPVRDVLATRPPAIPTLAQPVISREAPAQHEAPSTAEPAVLPASSPALPPLTMLPPIAAETDAKFCCLRFAATPESEPAESFPAGTETIYALWDYAGLVPGDRVRRIWFRDDMIWLTRDEEWNWDSYGASGTVRDIAIYDHEGSGLLPAHYRLQLYLNDAFQVESEFRIETP